MLLPFKGRMHTRKSFLQKHGPGAKSKERKPMSDVLLGCVRLTGVKVGGPMRGRQEVYKTTVARHEEVKEYIGITGPLSK